MILLDGIVYKPKNSWTLLPSPFTAFLWAKVGKNLTSSRDACLELLRWLCNMDACLEASIDDCP